MDSRVVNFIQVASVQALKDKLTEMGFPSNGIKATLRVRLEEATRHLDDDRINEFFPASIDETSNQDTEENFREDDGDEQQLEDLRRKVARKEEILALQKRLAELNNPSESQPSSCSFRDIEDSLQTFSGDDSFPISKWITNFEYSKEIYNLDDSKCFIFAQRLMKGTAKLFLRSTSCGSWAELKTALMNEFSHISSPSDVHNTLRNRKKRKDENLQQYVLKMLEIASSSNIEENDIISYIIRGIPDSSFNKQILFTASTIPELKTALRRYEQMKMDSSSSSTVFYKAVPQSKTTVHPNNKIGIKCYNCNDPGHVASKCPKPQRERGSCYRCGERGHIIKDCPKSSAVCLLQDADSDNASIFRDFHGVLDYYLQSSEYGAVGARISAVTMIDTGSPISFVQQKFIPPYLMTAATQSEDFVGINNSKLTILGKVFCKVKFNQNFVNQCLYIVKNDTMRDAFILGRDFLRKTKVKLSFENEYDDNNISLSECLFENDLNEILKIDTFDDQEFKFNLNINENLAYDNKTKLQKLVARCIADSNYVNKDPNDEVKMKIILKDPNSVFSCSPRRLPFAHKTELNRIIDDLLKRQIIRESNSPFASPIVLAKKKNGELRLCVDYRELNKTTIKDNFPLPVIEDILDGLRGKKYFTVLDLKNGFQHVKMSDESTKLTSFVTPSGQFEYRFMPFGLKNGPAVFQRFIESKFKNLLRSEKLRIYIDDLLVATETLDEHFNILEEVLNIIKKNHLQLRFDKCLFFYEQITYLGYTISLKGIRPNSDDFANFCGNNNIQHINIATSSLQSNGQVERINRTLTSMLAKESELNPAEWAKHLSKVEFALNNTINKSTGYCPSILLFGVVQKGEVNDKIREYLIENCVTHKSENLALLRQKASENIIYSQEKNKTYFDKKHKPPYPYKKGDLVLIKNNDNTPGTNKKLASKYKGPYEIAKLLPNDRFLIKDLENFQVSRIPYEGVVSPENMKLYSIPE